MIKKLVGQMGRVLEFVVSRPPLATVVVGSSILLLLLVVGRLAVDYPAVAGLRLIVPFLPPFFITRTAKRINMQQAEFDFVRDAEPLILVGFSATDQLEVVEKVAPAVVSGSVVRDLQLSSAECLATPMLPEAIFPARRSVLQELLRQDPGPDGRRALPSFWIEANPFGPRVAARFLMTAVIKPYKGRWKLQMVLVPDRS